jgi:hypothetical protein
MQDADRPLRRMEVAARIQELRRRQAEQDSSAPVPDPDPPAPDPPALHPGGSAPDPGGSAPGIDEPAPGLDEVVSVPGADNRLTGPEPGQPLTAAERIARMLLGGDGS